MIPYDIDPSLHTRQPEPPQLDDGFSPPRDDAAGPAGPAMPSLDDGAELLGDKSLF